MNVAVTLQPTTKYSTLFFFMFFLNSSSTFVFFNNFASSSYLYLCSLLCTSFSFAICCSFLITLSAFIFLWIPKLWKHSQLLATNTNYFWWLPHFFLSLNISLVTFIFSSTHHFLINAWFLKLIWPITTSLCVLFIATWKHLTSSLWMNVADFIFQLLHIHNLPTLFVLIPFRSL